MSKIFYDYLINTKEIEKTIKKASKSFEEKIELWQLVDEMIHHKVLGCILDHLPTKFHKEFLQKFHQAPHDEKLLFYLKEKVKIDIENAVKEAVAVLVLEIISGVKGKR